MWGPIMSVAARSYFGAASFYFYFPETAIDHRDFEGFFVEHDARKKSPITNGPRSYFIRMCRAED